MNTKTKKTLRVAAIILELVQDLVRDNRIRLLEERVNELEEKDRARRRRELRADFGTPVINVQDPFGALQEFRSHFTPRHPAGGTGYTQKNL